MFSFQEYRAYTESSQTTTALMLLDQDCLTLGFFDISSPAIRQATENDWERAAREVLQEHGELWEKLAQL